MRARILTIALLIAIADLPLPASQLLAEPFSASAPAAETSALATLMEDPFLSARLSYTAPKSWVETEAPRAI